MSAEDVNKVVDELIAKQKRLDAQDREVGEQIVRDAINIKTIEHAKQFAANWIATAAQESRNTEYMTGERDRLQQELEMARLNMEEMGGRILEARDRMTAERLAHDETRGYRQHAEMQFTDVRKDLALLLRDLDDAMGDVDPGASYWNGLRDKLVKIVGAKS